MVFASITSYLPQVLVATEAHAALPDGYFLVVDNTVRYIKVEKLRGNLRLQSGQSLFADITFESAATPWRLASAINLSAGSHVSVRNCSVNANFPPSDMSVDNSSALHLYNVTFTNGLVEEAHLNGTCILQRAGSASFLGETFPAFSFTLLQSEAFLFLPQCNQYFGFGVSSAPAGGLLKVIGKDIASVAKSGIWAFVEVSDFVLLHAQGTAGDVWNLVNVKGWNDGEAPAFGLETSAPFSSKIYKILAAPSAGRSLQLRFNLPITPFRVIHARNATNTSVKVIDGDAIVLELPADATYAYKGYTARTNNVVFSLEGAINGTFELNVETLYRNYYTNYSRVLGMLSGLTALMSLEPNYSVLPAEGYLAYLDGNLRDLSLANTKIAFASRMLASEGISLSGALYYTFCLPALIERALIEALGSHYAIKVIPTNGTYFVNIFCATKEEEAIIIARASALLNSFRRELEPLLGDDTPNLVIKAIHRGS